MKKLLILLLGATFLTSCAHKMMRGTVAMKTDNKTAHVCLGENDVKVGDSVEFYQNHCIGGGGGPDVGGEYDCELRVLGFGTVKKILNNHYSEVETNGSFKFREGTLVQKKN